MSVNLPGLSVTGGASHGAHPNDQIVTLCNKSDTPRIQMLDPETLEPVGLAHQNVLHPSLKGQLSAAHAKSDPETGDVFNFNLDISGPKSSYHVFRTNGATGETTILATVRHAPSYLHSLFLSQNYVILCVWNSHFTAGGVSVVWNKNLLESMKFNPDVPTTWYVIDRRCPQTESGRGLVATYESDPFFAFHTINAYEEPSPDGSGNVDIVADLPIYKNLDIVHHFYLENLLSDSPKAQRGPGAQKLRDMLPIVRRYRLPGVPAPPSRRASSASGLSQSNSSASSRSSSSARQAATGTSRARRTTMDFELGPLESMELPTFNFSYVTHPYRYVYGLLFAPEGKSTFVDSLVKYDFSTHKHLTWEVFGHTPGEAIFVPDPQGTEEDDGVLLSVVLDGYKSTSYLLVLDAKTMQEVGRADVPGVVGFGFHGLHTKLGVISMKEDDEKTTGKWKNAKNQHY